MKKLILSLALCFAAVAGFAQEASDPNQLLNEGKTALEAKNYQEAFDKLSAYLTQTNNEDSVIAFNCGVCADKIKKPAEAAKYFDIAIKKNYNLVNSYIGKVGALKDLKQNDEYVAALKEAMTAVPDNKATFEKMYVNFYLTQGVAAQKAKNTDAAAAAFKEVLVMQPQNLNALNALGLLYYTKGAGLVQSDMDKAKAEFATAKQYLDQLVPLLSESNAAQKKMLTNANTMLNYINSLK